MTDGQTDEARLRTECCDAPIEANSRFCQKCGWEARIVRRSVDGISQPQNPAVEGTEAGASAPQWPSDELLMMRAQQICERLNHNHNGPDVQFVYQQLQHVRMYAAVAPAKEPQE